MRPRPVRVQKYGGTSVGSVARIRRVARRAAEVARDHDLVLVVSAMGHTTDRLVALAAAINDDPDPREMDLLLSTGELVSAPLMAMALHALNVPAVSLTGSQAGIRTSATHSRARIRDVIPERIRAELSRGRAVVVAGFQGVTDEQDISTLGRGGSDTSAVALAAALEADRCEIFTDVDGIYTCDPREVPEARVLPHITYEEMLEMASVGARVMHPRAVEIGELYRVPIEVRSSLHARPGTIITEADQMEERNRVRGLAHDADVAKITVVGVPDRPGIAARLFEPLAEAGIGVDLIIQNVSEQGIVDMSFTVAESEAKKALAIVRAASDEIDARTVQFDASVAKVSVVGTGMLSQPGVAAKMFRTLADHHINIEMISKSEIRITCIIRVGQVTEALRALHSAFELDQQ
ncbi:MAG: aspartate kinase [Candidatus Dormibacteria bacterium]